ncbi:MAG TPA: CBS domain-containing protein [Noviherbaspirillum sp.]|nr:CBS domain-containing protein [Noviherbaspirillum sp.]
MAIKDFCNTDVVICDADTAVPDVAGLMRAHHVGDVIVIEERDGRRFPAGIVTDRDIVLEAVSVGLDVKVFTAGDLMTSPLITVNATSGVFETLQTMSRHRVRRIGVVHEDGSLYGVVSADDLIKLLAQELTSLTVAIADQPAKESRLRK